MSAGAGQDVAVCSRAWKWEWWTLFFQFAVLMSGLVVTALPSRLPRARYPLANLLSIACVLIMVSSGCDAKNVVHMVVTCMVLACLRAQLAETWPWALC